MAATSGFVRVTVEDLEELYDGTDAVNTKKSIAFAVKRLEAFALFESTTLAEIGALEPPELDKFLAKFYASLRRTDGTLYRKKSMTAIRYGIDRHFKEQRDLEIKSKLFPESNKAYKAVTVQLKKEGKGSVQHKASISQEDMGKMFSSEQLNLTTPTGLQNKVFMDIMIYFGFRGRENLRDMKPADFVVVTDEQNFRYIKHRDMLTKTRRENDEEAFSSHMYEIPGSPRCPVTSLLTYISLLNPGLDCFWQRPKESAPTQGSWYCNAPVGINILGNKMKHIAEAAGCSKKYTNHSLRATTVKVLDNAGFASRDIMSITGHKSESSLKHYSSTSDEKKKDMSNRIASKMMQQNSSSTSSTLTLRPTPHASTSSSRPSTTSVPPPLDSKSSAAAGQVAVNADDNSIESLLTLSQEQFILQESSTTSTVSNSTVQQHFHFHGPVNFYNTGK